MARGRQRTNPFYVLLIAIGVLFTLTASAYFVLALHGNAALAAEPPRLDGLLGFMDRHGAQLLVIELGLLAAATCGAIGTDHWWTAAPRPESSTDDRSA